MIQRAHSSMVETERVNQSRVSQNLAVEYIDVEYGRPSFDRSKELTTAPGLLKKVSK